MTAKWKNHTYISMYISFVPALVMAVSEAHPPSHPPQLEVIPWIPCRWWRMLPQAPQAQLGNSYPQLLCGWEASAIQSSKRRGHLSSLVLSSFSAEFLQWFLMFLSGHTMMAETKHYMLGNNKKVLPIPLDSGKIAKNEHQMTPT